MSVKVIADNSSEGRMIQTTLETSEDLINILNSYVIRWGNWLDHGPEGLTFNTPHSIKNTIDKESIILTLTRSKVKCPRRIKPGKKTEFPILGRKYDHKSGTDIHIIDSLDDYQVCDCDYFLSYLRIVEEYKVHIMDLDVFYIEEKYHPKASEFVEPIVRSKSYGWKLQKTTLESKPNLEKEEIMTLAKKGVYALGLDFGVVNIGRTIDGRYYVLDVDPTCSWMSEECAQAYTQHFIDMILRYESFRNTPQDVTIGADPECLLKDIETGAIVCASDFFSREGAYGYDDRSVEAGKKHFPLVELRPDFSTNPLDVVASIDSIMTDLYQNIHYKNIGLFSGSMPLYNYWLGGHIHFGIKPNSKLIRALDNYLALPIMMIEKAMTARQRKKNYGVLGNYRLKSHGGFEYCSISSWLISPEIASAILCLSKIIVQEYLNLQEEFLMTYSDLRAFFLVNKAYFKDKITRIIENLQHTKTYIQYQSVVEPILQNILLGQEWNEDKDIKEAWGLSPSTRVYKLPSRCFIPKKNRKLLGLKLGDVIAIRVGEKQFSAKVYPKDDLSSEKSGLISLSQDLCKDVGITEQDNVGIFYDAKNKVYRIGPIFGIFCYREPHHMGPFALQTYFFRKLIKLSKNKGMITYVFTIWEVDWENKRIEGYTYDFEKDEWKKQFYPLPDVIYDRGDVVSEDNYGQYALDYLENIKTYNIQFINSIECIDMTNNKWNTYQLLDSSSLTSPYQPATVEYNSTKTLLQYINKFKHVFLKMKDGSRSKGIFSIEEIKNDYYSIQYKNVYGYNMKLTVKKTDLISVIDTKIKEMECYRTDYIIQQAIPFAKYKDSNFEIRVVMQKNSQGGWYRTCMVARVVSSKEQFLDVWNESDIRYTEVLSQCFGDQAEHIANQLRSISRHVTSIMDERQIQVGEFAIDFGIDEDMNIYIIELNSKPDNLLARIGAFSMRNLACNRILEYGKFLVLQDLSQS